MQKVEGDRRPLQKRADCYLSSKHLSQGVGTRQVLYFPPCPRGPHLIDSEVDASIGDDPQHVGDVAFIEGSYTLFCQDPPGTVQHAGVLACFPQGHSGLQNLQLECQE